MNAALTGCDEILFIPPVCDSAGPYYFNDELDGSCPTGTTGGPFTVPAGMFVSLSSKVDANQKAQTYLNQTISGSCAAVPPNPRTFQVGTSDDQDEFSGTMTVALDGGSPQPIAFTISDSGTLYCEPFEASVSVVLLATIQAGPFTGVNFFELFLPSGGTGALLTGSNTEIKGNAPGGGSVTCLTGTTGPNNNSVTGSFDITTDLTGIIATSTMVNFSYVVGGTSTCKITWLLP